MVPKSLNVIHVRRLVCAEKGWLKISECCYSILTKIKKTEVECGTFFRQNITHTWCLLHCHKKIKFVFCFLFWWWVQNWSRSISAWRAGIEGSSSEVSKLFCNIRMNVDILMTFQNRRTRKSGNILAYVIRQLCGCIIPTEKEKHGNEQKRSWRALSRSKEGDPSWGLAINI